MPDPRALRRCPHFGVDGRGSAADRRIGGSPAGQRPRSRAGRAPAGPPQRHHRCRRRSGRPADPDRGHGRAHRRDGRRTARWQYLPVQGACGRVAGQCLRQGGGFPPGPGTGQPRDSDRADQHPVRRDGGTDGGRLDPPAAGQRRGALGQRHRRRDQRRLVERHQNLCSPAPGRHSRHRRGAVGAGG